MKNTTPQRKGLPNGVNEKNKQNPIERNDVSDLSRRIIIISWALLGIAVSIYLAIKYQWYAATLHENHLWFTNIEVTTVCFL